LKSTLGIGDVKRHLETAEIPSPTGKTWWDRTTIWGMQRIPMMFLVRNGSQFLVALFSAVQEQLQENRQRARQGQRGAKYLLQGLVVCCYAGRPSVPVHVKGIFVTMRITDVLVAMRIDLVDNVFAITTDPESLAGSVSF
jgi:hypothetical protein